MVREMTRIELAMSSWICLVLLLAEVSPGLGKAIFSEPVIEINGKPASTTFHAYPGQILYLKCAGNGEIDYFDFNKEDQFDGSPIDLNDKNDIDPKKKYKTVELRLTINSAEKSDEGSFKCIAREKETGLMKNASFYLYVDAPPPVINVVTAGSKSGAMSVTKAHEGLGLLLSALIMYFTAFANVARA